MLTKLSVPRQGLIGPWTHQRPDASPVGPRIDFFAELLAWWQRWLADQPHDMPPMRFFLQDAYRPARFPHTLPGQWLASDRWPPPGIQERTWYATSDRMLSPVPEGDEASLSFRNDVRVGLSGPTWCPTEPPDTLADDQRGDDLFALTFDSAPLSEPLTILGIPVLRAVTTALAPVAFLCVRLSHLWPDGAATLVTRGVLNLTRRNGLDRCDRLQPGTWVTVEVPLKACAYRIPAGHRLRLALSGADFPTLWPAPSDAAQLVRVGGRALELRLPVLTDTSQLAAVALAPPTPLPSTAETWTSSPSLQTFTDHVAGRVGLRRSSESVLRPLGRPVVASERTEAELWADLEHPARCCAFGTQAFRIQWPVGTAETLATLALHSTADQFHLTVELEAQWNGRRIARRVWSASFARDGL
jgi:predicted acyl esterase